MNIKEYKYVNEDALSFLQKQPEKSIKLMITSPPYNIGKEYETRTSLQNYLDNLKPIINEMYRVLSDDGSICWEVGNYVDEKTKEIFPLDIYYYELFKECGMQLQNRRHFINYHIKLPRMIKARLYKRVFLNIMYASFDANRYVKFKWCSFKQFKQHIKPNVILFIPVIAISLYRIMDKIMIGALSSIEVTGLYESADKIVSLPITITASVGTVAGAKFLI